MQKEDVLRRIAEALGINGDDREDESDVVRHVHQLTVQIGMERIETFWVPEREEYITLEDLNVLEIIIAGAFLGTEDEELPTDGLPEGAAEDLRAICEAIQLDASPSPAPSKTEHLTNIVASLRVELGHYDN